MPKSYLATRYEKSRNSRAIKSRDIRYVGAETQSLKKTHWAFERSTAQTRRLLDTDIVFLARENWGGVSL